MRKMAFTAIAAFVAACALAEEAPLGFADIAGKRHGEVEEGAPCCVTGVVTLVSGWRGLSGTVASASDPNGPAIWFAGEVNNKIVAELRGAEKLREGDVVEIRGTVSQLAFAPGLKADTVTALGATSLPQAPLRRLRDFDWGVMDNRRARIDGVLMDARAEQNGTVRLQFGTSDGMFLAHVGGSAGKWTPLVDAKMRIDGIAMSVFNIRSEYVGLQMEVLREGDIETLSPPPDASTIPLVPLGAVLAYSPDPPDSHRRRVRGVVTHVRKGSFVCIQDGENALVVNTPAKELKAGDVVEAVGFPRMEGGLCEMAFSQVVKTGDGRRPEPVWAGWVELRTYPVRESGSFQDFNARLVRTKGTLGSYAEIGGGTRLVMSIEGYEVEVDMATPLPDEVRECAHMHPTLELVGILLLEQERGLPMGRMPAIVGRRLLVESADDVSLLRDEIWHDWQNARTMRTVAIGAASVAFALLALLAFRFIRYRRDYKRLDILTKERKRMAGDLHDTIEQSLVTAKIMLDTAVSLSPEAPESMKGAIATAQEVLMSAKAEIRETIFNLRHDELFKRSAPDILRSLADKISARGIVKVRTRLGAMPDKLPATVLSDILFIIQEAATNAIKHGKARTIAIAADRNAGRILLRIANDGAPFDPAQALGPEAGHFGLSGMRERARRAGIGFSIGMEKNRVTIRLEVDI